MRKVLDRDEAMDLLMEAAESLGWAIAIPDEENVSGVIIGTEEFIESFNDGTFELWDFSGNGSSDPSKLN